MHIMSSYKKIFVNPSATIEQINTDFFFKSQRKTSQFRTTYCVNAVFKSELKIHHSSKAKSISSKQNLKYRVLFTLYFMVFTWSTDYKECHSGRIRGVGNAAIGMEQKHVKIGTSVF